MYFANPTTGTVKYMASGVLGFIDTPGQGNIRPQGVVWCADNGCFNDARFDIHRWWAWLESHAVDAALCRFAVAPDVVGDAEATLRRSRSWLPMIGHLGYPAAFVAQDGIERIQIPWDSFAALFIGGTTVFKLGPIARRVVYEAKNRGKYVHCGRVNSLRRYRYAEAIGCDSVDGTFLVFGPEKNLPRLLSWYRDLEHRPAMFQIGDAS